MDKGKKVKTEVDGYATSCKKVEEQIESDIKAVKSVVFGQEERMNWLKFNQFLSRALPRITVDHDAAWAGDDRRDACPELIGTDVNVRAHLARKASSTLIRGQVQGIAERAVGACVDGGAAGEQRVENGSRLPAVVLVHSELWVTG